MTMWEAADGSGAGPRQAAGAGLVGREDVLAQLRRAVEDAARGRGRLLLLTGEAGIGKTAVAAGAEGRGVRVVWGWSWQGEGAPAYWPWVQVFRSLVTKGGPPQPPPAPSLARLLPELPGSADPPVDVDELAPAARFRLLDELTSVLLAASEDRPLAVVLDDLQWADPPSIHLLDFVARQLPAARVLLLGTYRDLDQPPNDPLAPLLADLAARGTVIPMGALSEDEVARLVATIVGGEPEPALVAAVRRRTGGNPFFVQQVTRLLLAQAGATDGPLTGESVGIPFGVREAIERRLARLSPRCVEVVTAGAVVGPEFTAGLLVRVTGEPAGAVRDLLGEAARAHVLAGPTRPFRPYRFAHDLFRESIVEGLGGEVRARLHLRVGRALERERDAGGVVPPAQLANHFAQAGAGAADAAGRYAAMAAAAATQRLAYEEAARQWARALEALEGSARPDSGRRTELLLELAAARRRAGDLAGSRQASLQATELARRAADAPGLARAALSLQAVGTRSWPSLVHELVPVLEEAADALGDQDTPLRAQVLASLARELAWNGMDVARAARLADTAIVTARRTGDRATLASCLLAQHNAGWAPGNAADRLALAGQIAELAGDGGDLELLAEARLLRTADRLELADPAFQVELAEFLQGAATLGQPRLDYAALARRAMQALLAGRLGEAERLVAEAATLGREIGEPDAEDVELAQLWELRSLQGRRSELLPQARALFPDDSPQGRYFLAMTLLQRDDRGGAEAAAGPLLDLAAPPVFPADRNWTPSATFASELAATFGTRAAREWLYHALLPYAADAAVVGTAIVFRGAVAHYLGLLAAALDRSEEARAHFEHAVAIHERLGARAWVLKSRYELARVLPTPDEVAETLVEVAETSGQLGMTELTRLAADRRGATGATASGGGVFRRVGALWTLCYSGRTVRMRDAKGLHDLAVLLGAPGRPVPAAELVAGSAGEEAVPADLRMGADEVLDDRARRELRARLVDLEEEIDEADRWHDPERAARAALERDVLLRELAAATGLAGRARRLGDQSERARKTVTARIRDVIDRVERVHPALGAHLRGSVTTGTFCAYSPPAPTAWEL
ncbi:MAG TPA: AAA family ATPase [Actinomycetota bacterium]|nr:AAA family ATPase [Actinomycetota bacterium]